MTHFSHAKKTISGVPQTFVERLRKLSSRAPAHVLSSIDYMPQRVSEPLLSLVLNKLFTTALEDEDLNFLHKKYLKLVVSDSNLTCFITVTQHSSEAAKILVNMSLPPHLSHADVEFSADTKSLILLANKMVDPDTLFFQRKLLVTGKTELGLAIKNFIDDYDFEENIPTPIQHAIKQLSHLLSEST